MSEINKEKDRISSMNDNEFGRQTLVNSLEEKINNENNPTKKLELEQIKNRLSQPIDKIAIGQNQIEKLREALGDVPTTKDGKINFKEIGSNAKVNMLDTLDKIEADTHFLF